MLKKVKPYLFYMLWVAAAYAALMLYLSWNTGTNFAGIVETRTHKLGPSEAGVVKRVAVSLGNTVKAGDTLVELDSAVLENERDLLRGELDRLNGLLEADMDRYALEYERLRMQRDANESDVGRSRAEFEARKAELKSLNTEIDRLSAAEKAGLGRSRDLSALLVRRDTTARLIEEEGRGLPGAVRGRSAGRGEPGAIIRSMASGKLERINELKLKLRAIEGKIESSRLLSPCDCRVVKVNNLPGDVVKAFATIVTVEEPKAAFVDVYIPETSSATPHVNQRIEVYPHRNGQPGTMGTIVFVDPGYSAIPDRLAFRKAVYWARKFRARLDNGHQLMPGEAARVEMVEKVTMISNVNAGEAQAPKKEPPGVITRTRDTLQKMSVPESLRNMSSFEPSGVTWLEDIGRYLIVSDDTSLGAPMHAPWLFLMDQAGTVEPKPVVLRGTPQLNDLESIAAAPDGTLYLVSSQNISRKGKRPESRQQLLKVRRAGRDFEVVSSVDLLNAIKISSNQAILSELGIDKVDSDGQPVLNIEGTAWLNGDLLFGLKQPRQKRGAIVWRLKDPEGLFKTSRLNRGQLSVFGYADLRSPDGREQAISDLVVTDNGELYALSTVPGARGGEQMGGLSRLEPMESDRLKVTPYYAFPGMKPEGICKARGSGYMVVFDTDNQSLVNYLAVELPSR